MRISRFILAVCVVAVTVIAGGLAHAGGASSLDLDQRYLVVGHTVTGRTIFWTEQFQGTGSVEDGPYFAYLLPGDTLIRPPVIPPAAIPLGHLRISRDPGPTALAWLTFTVPDVPAGDYTIDFCNDPCTHSSVGDLYGTWASIVATPLDARLAALEDRYEQKLDRVEWKLERRIRQIGRAQQRVEDMSGSQTTLAGRVSDLQREVDELRRSSRARPEAGGPWWIVGGAGVAVLGVLLARRRRKTKVPGLREADGATVVVPVTSDMAPQPPEREMVSSRT